MWGEAFDRRWQWDVRTQGLPRHTGGLSWVQGVKLDAVQPVLYEEHTACTLHLHFPIQKLFTCLNMNTCTGSWSNIGITVNCSCNITFTDSFALFCLFCVAETIQQFKNQKMQVGLKKVHMTSFIWLLSKYLRCRNAVTFLRRRKVPAEIHTTLVCQTKCSVHTTICLPLEFILEMQQFSHCVTSKISLGMKKQTNVFLMLPSGKTLITAWTGGFVSCTSSLCSA